MKVTTTINKNIPELKQILLLFFSTRLALIIIGIFSRSFLERQYGKQYIWSQQLWLDIWGVWDSFWYLDIAEHGYADIGRNPLSTEQANYAFFPLYPLLMRILGTAIGDKYFIAGIIISNICLLGSCFLLYKLVELKFERSLAYKSVKFLFLMPTAFIFSGVFTESLYLMLAISCFYFAEKRNWFLVSILGFLLSLTRSLGVFIIFPVIYKYLKERKFDFKKIDLNIFYLLLIPLGLVLFSVYNYHLTGDFFAFSKIQSSWGRSLSNPLMIIGNGLLQGIVRGKMTLLLESSFSIAALLCLVIFYKKMEFSYWIFALYSILIPLLTGIGSMPRYILPIFPFYILLAKLSSDRNFEETSTLFLGFLQGFLMVFWSSGYALIV